MLEFDTGKLLILGIIALLVIGPKDLPRVMRVAGYWLGRARAMSNQFRAGFDQMVREAELAEMEKKWASENARIMSGHQTEGVAPHDIADTSPANSLPEHVPTDHAAATVNEIPSPSA